MTMIVLFFKHRMPKYKTLPYIPSNVPSKTEPVSSCISSKFHPSSIQIPSKFWPSIQLPSNFHPSIQNGTGFICCSSSKPGPSRRKRSFDGTGYIRVFIQRIPSKICSPKAEPVSSNSPSNAFHPKIIHPKRNRFHPILHPTHSIQKLSIQSGTGFIQLPSTSILLPSNLPSRHFSIQNGTSLKQCFRQIPSKFPSARQKPEPVYNRIHPNRVGTYHPSGTGLESITSKVLSKFHPNGTILKAGIENAGRDCTIVIVTSAPLW